jgi:hypothetical protein
MSDKILKVDLFVVKEFLGETDNIVSMISPLKHARCYAKKGGKRSEVIMVLTPLTHDNMPDYLSENFKKYGATEHKRGNNFVYTFTE